MTHVHSLIFVLHVICGALALMLFWVPIFTQKGRLNHIKFGHYYKIAMYSVAATGVLMASIVIAIPLVINAQYAQAENADEIAFSIRMFSGYLIYLALLTYTTTRHGIVVLIVRTERQKLRTLSYLLPLWTLLIFGVVLFTVGLLRTTTLFIVFGILGALIAVGMLKYCLAKSITNKQWILEHIGSMIGSGIGAYTAFMAFGGRTLFSELGSWQLIFWVAPGVIGGIASYIVCKRYEQVFSVKPIA